MKDVEFHVKAVWDAEAEVWVATSDDIPGLVTEADTPEALLKKLSVMIPELLEANGIVMPDEIPEVPVHFLTERTEKIRLRVA